jgi:hypothetical protein
MTVSIVSKRGVMKHLKDGLHLRINRKGYFLNYFYVYNNSRHHFPFGLWLEC